MKNLNERMKRLLLLALLCSSGAVMAVPPPVVDTKIKADKAFDNGKYRAAGIHYQRLLRDDPANAGHRIKLAKSYELGNQLELAEKHAEQVLKSEKNNVAALQLMGTLRARQGDWQASKTYFENAIKVAPEDENSYIGLSTAFVGLENYAGAEQATQAYQSIVNKKKDKRNKK